MAESNYNVFVAEPLANLSAYTARDFDRGRSIWTECLWRMISACLFQSSFFPFYSVKRILLRLFGAKIGRGVLIKPRVTITFPWRVVIGDHAWIGEGVWLDSLAMIRIGSNVCISQGAYLCTGNHNYKSPAFDLMSEMIEVGDNAWIGAQTSVGPGVHVGAGAILTLGSVATTDLETRGIYRGNPAVQIGNR